LPRIQPNRQADAAETLIELFRKRLATRGLPRRQCMTSTIGFARSDGGKGDVARMGWQATDRWS
jgi:hypothetical protein